METVFAENRPDFGGAVTKRGQAPSRAELIANADLFLRLGASPLFSDFRSRVLTSSNKRGNS